jgi:CRISPR-associated protein Cmr2
MTHLLKFSFGPVQDFIAAARKLEDLMSGSAMLDELMQKAQATVVSHGVVIYPAAVPTSNQKLVNHPNILLAKVDGDGVATAEAIVAAVREHFSEMINKCLDSHLSNFQSATALRQIGGFLEISWAAVRWDGSDGDFKRALIAVNTKFDAVKRTRVFAQQQESGPKCTLQPALSALPPVNGVSSDGDIRHFWRNLGISGVRHDKGERFSAIGLAKRLYRRNLDSSLPCFPSTYSVSTAMWRRRLLEQCEKTVVKKALEDLGAPSGDTKATPNTIPALLEKEGNGHAFLNWEPQVFVEPEEACEREATQLKRVRDFLHAIGESELGIGEPPKHYALLVADGDSMGRVVDARESVVTMQELSKALNDFAACAARLAESPTVCGRSIYAGGDDVMAVTPVETALNTACEWRRLFADRMNAYTFTGDDNKPRKATLSVALLVAPVDYPLNRLLRESHQVLNSRAKADEKDALAIVVYKGDSEACSVILPTEAILPEWIEPTPRPETAWMLDAWSKGIKNLISGRKLSTKTMYDLRETLGIVGEMWQKDLAMVSSGERGTKREHARQLLGSIINARLATNRSLNEDDVKKLRETIEDFLAAIQTRSAEKRFRNPELVADVLIVLRNLGRMSCL